MNSDLSSDDQLLLEQYADEALPPEQLQAFEHRLTAEPLLQAALAQHRLFVAGIRAVSREALRERLSRLDAELAHPEAARQAVSPPPMRVVKLWPRLAAAATVVLAAGLGVMVWLRGPNYQAEADRYGLTDPGLPVLMSDATTIRPLVTQAMNAYKTGHYADALAVWERLQPDQIGADTLRYYRGIFLLRLHRPTEAAAELAQVRALAASPLHQPAEYYHALALWADGRVVGARAAFEQLARRQAHPYAPAAQAALPHVK